MSHGKSKLIAVDKQTNDNVVQLDGFRKADRFAGQSLDARTQPQMLAFNLLCIAFARDMGCGG